VRLGGWATVIGLSMVPALIAGPSAACAAGIGFGFEPVRLVAVVTAAGFVEGLFVAWLGGPVTRIGWVERHLARFRTPRAVELANKYGVWGGMTIGVAVVGQEPILVALRALGVDMKRLVFPVLVSNALFSVLYYFIVRFGIDQLLKLPF
jgi:membrane protein YqaA with SNARE-associated domain